MKTTEHCSICRGKGRVDGVICVTCGGTGFVEVDHGPSDPGPGPGWDWGGPVTGVLRLLGYIMLGGIILAAFLSFQNAPGDGQDKMFAAAITFGLLGLVTIVILRLLAAAWTAIFAAIILGGVDVFANKGKIIAGIQENAGPAFIYVLNLLRYLVFDPTP